MLDEDYISKKKDKYIIQREFEGIEYFFGEYSTIDEAISRKKWLDSHGWPVSKETLKKIDEVNSNISEIYDPLKFNINTQNKSYKQDILNLMGNIIEEDSKIPFPQSDDLNRFIFIGQCLFKEDLSKEDIKQSNKIGDRIVNMYTSTGFYFHVFEKYKKDNKIFYKLSDKGKVIFSLDEYNRNLNICKCILEHEIFYKIFMDCLSNNNINKQNIVNIMLNYDLNLKSMVTIERRAGCVSSWMHWIFNLMNGGSI